MEQSLQRDPDSHHIVIFGCGVVALSVATALADQGHVVHVLDSRTEALDRLPMGKIEDGNIIPILGNGTLQQGLLKTSIQDASVFIALSNVDTINALSAQIAKHIHEVPVVICLINDPVKQEMYADLDVVAISGANLATEMVLDAANA